MNDDAAHRGNDSLGIFGNPKLGNKNLVMDLGISFLALDDVK